LIWRGSGRLAGVKLTLSRNLHTTLLARGRRDHVGHFGRGAASHSMELRSKAVVCTLPHGKSLNTSKSAYSAIARFAA
jgi:hypothetical protein